MIRACDSPRRASINPVAGELPALRDKDPDCDCRGTSAWLFAFPVPRLLRVGSRSSKSVVPEKDLLGPRGSRPSSSGGIVTLAGRRAEVSSSVAIGGVSSASTSVGTVTSEGVGSVSSVRRGGALTMRSRETRFFSPVIRRIVTVCSSRATTGNGTSVRGANLLLTRSLSVFSSTQRDVSRSISTWSPTEYCGVGPRSLLSKSRL